jgi:lactoylglutathione lyase
MNSYSSKIGEATQTQEVIMLELGATYLLVRDMDRSIKFYSQLLEMKPTSKAHERWAQFDFDGKSFALFNQIYDYQAVAGGQDLDRLYSKAYLKRLSKHKTVFGNNIVLRFQTEDLNKEYERVMDLDIGPVSDILNVNISEPSYFFFVTDPDGNLLEFSGAYSVPIVTPVIKEEKETPKVRPIEPPIPPPVIKEEKESIPKVRLIETPIPPPVIKEEKETPKIRPIETPIPPPIIKEQKETTPKLPPVETPIPPPVIKEEKEKPKVRPIETPIPPPVIKEQKETTPKLPPIQTPILKAALEREKAALAEKAAIEKEAERVANAERAAIAEWAAIAKEAAALAEKSIIEQEKFELPNKEPTGGESTPFVPIWAESSYISHKDILDKQESLPTIAKGKGTISEKNKDKHILGSPTLDKPDIADKQILTPTKLHIPNITEEPTKPVALSKPVTVEEPAIPVALTNPVTPEETAVPVTVTKPVATEKYAVPVAVTKPVITEEPSEQFALCKPDISETQPEEAPIVKHAMSDKKPKETEYDESEPATPKHFWEKKTLDYWEDRY